MPEFWTNTVKYYRLAIKEFLPVIKELREKNKENISILKKLDDLTEMYEDVAKEIDRFGLNLADPNRFYDGEPDDINLNLKVNAIEHFSRLMLRLLNCWQARMKEIENKDYVTDEKKEEYRKLKKLAWPLESEFTNTSKVAYKYMDKGAIVFPGEKNEDRSGATLKDDGQNEELKRIKKFSDYNFHPLIVKVSYSQFQDGYYKEAIQNAFVEVIDYVKQKAGNPTREVNGKKEELDGDKLMNKVFGCDNEQTPIIKLNSLSGSLDRAEQRGFMNIYKGIVGIRDKKAHLNFIQDDPLKTMEYLSLASLLLRLVDDNTNKKIEF